MVKVLWCYGEGTPIKTHYTLPKNPQIFHGKPHIRWQCQNVYQPLNLLVKLQATRIELALLFPTSSLKGGHQEAPELYLLH